MAVSIVIGCEVNSQSIANNTSNVTCWVSAVWTGGSYNLLEKSGYLTIDGTKYTFTSPFNTERTSSGSVRMFTKTVNITHDSDGTKTLALSASYTSGVSSGTVAASANVKLDSITRASVLTKPPSSGTLGEPITFTINRQGSSDIEEYLYYHYRATRHKDGSASWYPVRLYYWESDVRTTWTYKWTPSLSILNDVHDSDPVVGELRYMCRSKSDGTVLSSKTYDLNLEIPDSIKPSVEYVELIDVLDHTSKYGNPIKGLTRFHAEFKATLAYSSPIKVWTFAIGKTTQDITKSASSDSTQNLVKPILPQEAGEVDFKVTVTDGRGRKGSATITKTVLDYKQPVIEKLTVLRCDFDGTENDQGEYVRVKFTSTVTPLNNVNSAKHTLRYKKSTDTEYITVDLESNSFTDGKPNEANTAAALITANKYSVTDAVYIFPADSGSSYDVAIQLEDDFITETRATSASTAFTLMHWKADGTGMAIGKISEEPNLFDIALPTRFNQSVCGNVMGLNVLPEIPANSDFNDYMATGSYAVYTNANAATIANIPVARAGRLEVSSSTGSGIKVTEWSYIRQKFIPYNSSNPTWERDVTRSENNIWTYGEWYRSSLTPAAAEEVYKGQKVLWGGDRASGMHMTAEHTANLVDPDTKEPAKITEQKNGIVLVFCYYNGTDDTNYNFITYFVPKLLVTLEPGQAHAIELQRSRFLSVGTKYLYINDTNIVGHNDNTTTGTNNGISYANNKFVLRYVLGV